MLFVDRNKASSALSKKTGRKEEIRKVLLWLAIRRLTLLPGKLKLFFRNCSKMELVSLGKEHSDMVDDRVIISQKRISNNGKDETQFLLENNTEGTNHHDDKPLSYYDLVRNNHEYRLFITSYLITNLGEWLTYIASIDFIEDQLKKSGEEQPQRSAISLLVVVRLLPNVVLACFGGTLADAQDRRNVMVVLNIAGAISALVFVLAYQVESLWLIYVATLLQQCMAGLYAPSSSAIIPMLVNGDEELKKATTLEGICWSGMTAFGAAASGFVVDIFGSRTCFLLDGLTFLISAALLAMLPGKYDVTLMADYKSEEKPSYESPWKQFTSMAKDGATYLWTSYFGPIALLKGTLALAYGSADILFVAFSEEDMTGDDPDHSNSNAKLGVLFSLMGVGCLLGPLITEPLIDLERPTTVQLSCVIGFVLSFIGYSGWSWENAPFWVICIFALIRSAGSSTTWINSTLLLQKFSDEHILGRVLAIDYALALLGEALAAYICGIFMDRLYLDAHQVSFILAIFSVMLVLIWGWYHLSGRGAGKYVPTVTGD